MRNIRFWIPAIVGALVPAIPLYLTSMSSDHAGAGLGSFVIFYPVPLFAMMIFSGGTASDAFTSHGLSFLALGAAILQFPLYGFTISYATLKKSSRLKVCVGIIWLHIIAIVLFLVVAFMNGLL